MNKKEKERYKNQRPIGVMCLSNWGGIEVMDYFEEDGEYKIVWRFNYGEPQELHKVQLNVRSERMSFRAGNMTIHLDEVMRV